MPLVNEAVLSHEPEGVASPPSRKCLFADQKAWTDKDDIDLLTIICEKSPDNWPRDASGRSIWQEISDDVQKANGKSRSGTFFYVRYRFLN